MNKNRILLAVVVILVVLFLIIKILKWPIIIATIALIVYLGYRFLNKGKK